DRATTERERADPAHNEPPADPHRTTPSPSPQVRRSCHPTSLRGNAGWARETFPPPIPHHHHPSVPSVSRVLSVPEGTGRSFLSAAGRPTALAANPRRLDRRGLLLAAYSALLPLGFAMPTMLPRSRWALTPPFHPYRRPKTSAVCSLLHCPSRLAACPGVTWQRVQGARTFLGAGDIPATRSSDGTVRSI
ncbi:MAG: hypothetical protein RL340_171, partial [Gemmatimonadota bacterium]